MLLPFPEEAIKLLLLKVKMAIPYPANGPCSYNHDDGIPSDRTDLCCLHAETPSTFADAFSPNKLNLLA